MGAGRACCCDSVRVMLAIERTLPMRAAAAGERPALMIRAAMGAGSGPESAL